MKTVKGKFTKDHLHYKKGSDHDANEKMAEYLEKIGVFKINDKPKK